MVLLRFAALGWLLSGAVDSSHGSATVCTQLILTNEPECIPKVQDPIQEVLQKFWEVEPIGIFETSHKSTDNFLSHIQFQDGRYKVSLPWQEGHFDLPTHYSLSLIGCDICNTVLLRILNCSMSMIGLFRNNSRRVLLNQSR